MQGACYIEDGRFYENGCITKVTRAYTTPTIPEVLKWLREEKEIYLVIQPFPTMATKNKICWSWDIKRNSDGVYIEHTSTDDMTYATYEQAALTGIEHVLDKLIMVQSEETEKVAKQ